MFSVKMPKLFQPFRCDDLVRLGKDYDGGYLVNIEDVKRTEALISFGVGSDVSFEQDFTKINPCLVNAFDASAEKHSFFDGNARNQFWKNISNYNSVDTCNISEVVIKENTFIKCDIEGDEYKLFDRLIDISSRLSGMVIEVHGINNYDNYNNLINFISKIDLKLIHIHINNYFYYIVEEENKPDILELSFSSSKNLRYDPDLKLPHKLDMNNNPQGIEFRISY